jgi:hypothetical protein
LHTLPRDEWMRLAREEAEPSVTLMVDLEPSNPDRRSVKLRIQHLCEEAERRLEALGVSEEKRRELLEPVRARCTQDSEVPRESESLVALLSPSIQEVYPLDTRLGDRVEVGDHFVLSPLAVQQDEEPATWYVLTVADDSARLIKVEYGEIEEVPLPLERKDRSEANAERVDPEPAGSLHSNRFSSRTVSGRPVAHPQGYGQEDVAANEREMWFRFVDQALHSLLAGSEAPVVLAANVMHHDPFRKVCSYRLLLDQGIQRHPVSMSDAEIVEQARPFVRSAPDQTLLSDRYFAAKAEEKTTSSLEDALSAARNGQIDTLMWVPGVPQRDDEQQIDLLDEIVRLTAIQGGAVQALPAEQLPEPGDGVVVNAILRWPLGRNQ